MSEKLTNQIHKLLDQLDSLETHVNAHSTLRERARENEEVLRILVRELEKEASSHRWHVAMILDELGARATSSVPALVRALISEDEHLRPYAALALGGIGIADADLVGLLREGLGDQSPHLKIAVASSLLLLASPCPEAIEVLERLTMSCDLAVKSWAVMGLTRVAAKVPEVRPILVALLGDYDDEVVEDAVRALAVCDPEDVIPLLLNSLSGGPRERRGVLMAFEKLNGRAGAARSLITEAFVRSGVFEDSDRDVRRTAADASAALQLNAARIKDRLTKLLDDPDEWVCERAAAALLRIDGVPGEEKRIAAKMLLKLDGGIPEEEALAKKYSEQRARLMKVKRSIRPRRFRWTAKQSYRLLLEEGSPSPTCCRERKLST